MLKRAALCFMLTSATAARADVIFNVQIGQWMIGGGRTSCTAVNRPAAEINYVPINAMLIREDEKHAKTISVYFWPGALPETASALKFTVYSGGQEWTFTAAAQTEKPEWNLISTTGPLPDDFLKLLTGTERLFNMSVGVPDSSAMTVFSVEDISRVLWQLSDCAGRLKPAP